MSAYPADRVAVYVAAPLLRWAVDGEAHARTLEAFAMTLPPWLARANRRVTNRLWGPLAPHLPGFGVIVHAGRKSHRRYRTPVNVFPRADGYVIALT